MWVAADRVQLPKQKQEEFIMKLSAPKAIVFWISLIVGIIAIAGMIIPLGIISGFAPWLLVGAFVLLVLGNMLKGL